MSIALHAELKRLRQVVEALENRVLLLEMQKRPVEVYADIHADMTADPTRRKTLTLRSKAA